MRNFSIMGADRKIRFLEGVGGIHEKPIYWGSCPVKGVLDSLQV